MSHPERGGGGGGGEGGGEQSGRKHSTIKASSDDLSTSFSVAIDASAGVDFFQIKRG